MPINPIGPSSGANWPATPPDRKEALKLCEEIKNHFTAMRVLLTPDHHIPANIHDTIENMQKKLIARLEVKLLPFYHKGNPEFDKSLDELIKQTKELTEDGKVDEYLGRIEGLMHATDAVIKSLEKK